MVSIAPFLPGPGFRSVSTATPSFFASNDECESLAEYKRLLQESADIINRLVNAGLMVRVDPLQSGYYRYIGNKNNPDYQRLKDIRDILKESRFKEVEEKLNDPQNCPPPGAPPGIPAPVQNPDAVPSIGSQRVRMENPILEQLRNPKTCQGLGAAIACDGRPSPWQELLSAGVLLIGAATGYVPALGCTATSVIITSSTQDTNGTKLYVDDAENPKQIFTIFKDGKVQVSDIKSWTPVETPRTLSMPSRGALLKGGKHKD